MVRRGLGRGLDALFEDSGDGVNPAPPAEASKVEGSASVPVDLIDPGPFQPRHAFDAGKLDELARSLVAQGVIEPLIARRSPTAPGRLELIAGERRLKAARLAGLGVVPVIVREADDRAALEISLVENANREDLNPVEEAQALARLQREFGYSHEELASRIGKSRPYVTNAIRLLELPDEVLEMLNRGELSAGHARALLALPTPQARLAAARRTVRLGASVRQVERMVGSAPGAAASRGRRAVNDAELAALGEELQRGLRRKVRIVRLRRKGSGRVEIEFYDDHDLNALASSLLAAGRVA